MRGVDAAYAVHHLIEVPALRGLLNEAAHNPFLKPTAAELPGNLRELVAPKTSQDQLPVDDDPAPDRPVD